MPSKVVTIQCPHCTEDVKVTVRMPDTITTHLQRPVVIPAEYKAQVDCNNPKCLQRFTATVRVER